ncbi:hypothetical protein IE81DRAFT_344768 [Ceraceosorus guamensis]|uniref:WIBG Mago-binding domain-containing protein n=1 Tax=Ceraceosorus guamensis TaxID=1522189 RepID=A0A316W776_9BASI|nr:hypothetical protein IE81DRAFT_344768 [Ceraceosorus guamensis]PWN45464.1 hypothetical protein IE81DRAFT_344768 [Ceraceosorus guamensis]
MSKPAVPGQATTASGIVESGQERVIPGSVRADGSQRKERKVRPGFTPAEDVGRFRSSRQQAAEALSRRPPPGSVPGSLNAASGAAGPSVGLSAARSARSGAVSSSTAPGAAPRAQASSKADESTSWRSMRKTSASQTPDAWDDDDDRTPAKTTAAVPNKDKRLSAANSASALSEDSRRARAVAKKLRAAEALQDKQQAGEEKLSTEQRAKVDGIERLRQELKALEVKDEARKSDKLEKE